MSCSFRFTTSVLVAILTPILTALPAALATLDAGEPIFAIGEANNSFSELACAGRHEFTLTAAEEGVCELVLDFVDTQSAAPPVLEVAVNGVSGRFRLERGLGDPSLKSAASGREQVLRIPFPASILRCGENTVSIANVSGSWGIDDAIRLERGAATDTASPSIAASATPFLRRSDARLLQEIEVSLRGGVVTGGKEILVRIGGRDYREPRGEVGLGETRVRVGVEPVASRTAAGALWKGSAGEARCEVTVEPVRRWRIFLVPSVHVDIGYTDLQARVIERHNLITDFVVRLCAEFPFYHWQTESSWTVEQYLENRGPAERERYLGRLKEGRNGVEGAYLNMLTGLCSHEELIRMLYPSRELSERLGVRVESVTLTDAPLHVGTLPSVLAGAGIRYLSMGINEDRAPLLKLGALNKLSPVFWEGPDGSRILAWFAQGYAQADRISLNGSLDEVRERVTALVRGYGERRDPPYPFDAILLHGAYSDNVMADARIPERLDEYRKLYACPEIVLASNAEFFRAIEEQGTETVPVVKGDGGAYWEDGAASSALETAMNRANHERAIEAEVLWSIAGRVAGAAAPLERLRELWKRILLYDEHTWGAWCSISAPDHTQTLEQWKVKQAYAVDADREANALIAEAAHAVSGEPARPDGVLAVNSLGWRRSGAAELEGGASVEVLLASGEPAPAQSLEDGSALYWLEDLPALGARSLKTRRLARPRPLERSSTDSVLENRWYRVELDARTGTITKLIDKELGRALTPEEHRHGFGRFLYVLGAEGTRALQHDLGLPLPEYRIETAGDFELLSGARGPVFESRILRGRYAFFPKVELEVRLWAREKRLDLVYRVDKEKNLAKEMVYLAFPLGFESPAFRYENPGGTVDPEAGQLPGACRDWYAVQHWVMASEPGFAVLLAPLDAPLVSIGGIHAGKWQKTLEVAEPALYGYAMNNIWRTNYRAHQEGPHGFRYALTSARDASPGAGTRLGWEAARPLSQIAGVGSARAGDLSLAETDDPNVYVNAAKPAEAGDGSLVLRLFEASVSRRSVRVRFPSFAPKKVAAADLLEAPKGEELRLERGELSLDLAPHGYATLRLWY